MNSQDVPNMPVPQSAQDAGALEKSSAIDDQQYMVQKATEAARNASTTSAAMMTGQASLPIAPPARPSNNIPTITLDDDNEDTTDSLDEEWIQKAKAIVEQTRIDPFQQSNKISRIKADYLKAHYNKDIKVAEDHPR